MIRKMLTTLGTAMALTFSLANPASAAVVNTAVIDNVFMNFGADLDTVGFFADAGYDPEFFTPYAVGARVDDYFLYVAPPVSSRADFVALANLDGNFEQTFKLTGFSFGVFGGAAFDSNGFFIGYDFDPLATDQTFLAKSGYTLGGESRDFLDSGIYYVEIQGTVMVEGGGFSGEINTAPIPEPGNALLLSAGLGLLGLLARRRGTRGASR